MGCLYLLLVLGVVAAATAQDVNRCIAKKPRNCGECIIIGPECGWCKQESYDNTRRCDQYQSLLDGGCPRDMIVYPRSKLTIIKDEFLSTAYQLKPQEVTIKIRAGEPYTFRAAFRQAEDYPVDLYYLMDMSKSMEDDLQSLRALGDTLAEEMQMITKNFRIGFGSFVDKTVMPYVSTVPKKLLEPCSGCAAPFGYKNVLPLTTRTNMFTQELNLQEISGNLDAPEGGFDAMMQAAVCTGEIGWRNGSTHLLVFSTDSSFHYAGDGKLGGIVTPNDGRCHLDDDMMYTFSNYLDYPSVGHLQRKLKEHRIRPIFAVTADQASVYGNLSDLIEGSVVGTLAGDSSNVVDLIKSAYEELRSTVELKTEDVPNNVTLKFRSVCLNNETFDGAKCSNLQVGDTVYFDITVVTEGCPSRRPKTFTVYPVGFQEELLVKLDFICDCGCQADGIVASPLCSDGNGIFECGACNCNAGRYGPQCECTIDDNEASDFDATCRQANSSVICSGRGECICGECVCFPRDNPREKVYGPFCECDNFSCDRYEGLICGGAGRGVCNCGVCECTAEWEGSACQCPAGNSTCVATNGLLCNDQGLCECGICNCFASSLYRGPTCEECPTCPGQCELLRPCVQCEAFGTGELDEDECKLCDPKAIIVDELKQGDEVTRCVFKDEDDCSFIFTYGNGLDGNMEIEVQRTKVCPEEVNILAIILGVIGGILGIGLALLLIWKLLMTIHDRREFAKFEKERMNAKWDTGENPIYKQATSTFKNPTYGGK
ncbi:integrin beta-1-like [Branchiostoma floridae]|uniref:Integrin beta n=1 Tax=Branchiostoma floridae TaxID=7739 RepID=A0A9J7LTZ5_BRAFL|nr:integrin beta-1-like [Branchiostoma floridae]